MSKITEIRKSSEEQQKAFKRIVAAAGASVDGGDGGGYDGDMEARVTALETRLDTILPTLATKTDIESVKTEIHSSATTTTRWMIGTVLVLFFGFAALINSMKPAQQPPAVQTQPQVIVVPQAQIQQPPQNAQQRPSEKKQTP